MTFDPARLKRQLDTERKRRVVIKGYVNQGRWIDSEIYQGLKQKRVCERCGRTSKRRLKLHHKQPVAQGGGNERSNLVALCEQCHQEIHRGEHEEKLYPINS